jgi:site-specific DNA-methyltransferase (adenine-specific)/modification methylase
MEMNKIYNEDCFVTMNHIPSNSINTIITSPPYNTGKRVEYWNNKIVNGERVYSRDKRYDEYLDTKTSQEYINWSIDLFQAYDKILMTDGCILFNISYGNDGEESIEIMWLLIAEIIKSTNFTVADCISWKKSAALPNSTSKNKLTRICEFIFVFVRKSEVLTFNTNKSVTTQSNKGQNFYEVFYNFIEAKNNDESNDLNKATFSTELIRKLLLIYTKKNDLIYDSFMGTGTTANACVIEKRNYLGSEISEKQCAYAEQRLRITKSQFQLF